MWKYVRFLSKLQWKVLSMNFLDKDFFKISLFFFLCPLSANACLAVSCTDQEFWKGHLFVPAEMRHGNLDTFSAQKEIVSLFKFGVRIRQLSWKKSLAVCWLLKRWFRAPSAWSVGYVVQLRIQTPFFVQVLDNSSLSMCQFSDVQEQSLKMNT